MSTNEEKWMVVGLQTKLKVMPDHQLDSYKKISEDSLQIFRISLIVLGIFLTLFGISLRLLPNVMIDPISAQGFIISFGAFVLTVGGSIYTYAVASTKTNNAIPSTEYIELNKNLPQSDDNDLSEEQLIYKYYWKKSTNYGNSIRGLQYILGLTSYSLYIAVIMGPIAFLHMLINFPNRVVFLAISMPLIIFLTLHFVIRLFSGFEGEFAIPESELKDHFED